MDYIIIAVLAGIVIIAILRSIKHFKGGGNTIRDKKSLTAPKIGEKVMTIEGMHCENCEIRVENVLNRLDHVACKVSWKKKNAVISYSEEVSDEMLKETVERLGYQGTQIRS